MKLYCDIKRITAYVLAAVLILPAVQFKAFAENENNFVSIYAEEDMSYGIKADGTAWKWGNGSVIPIKFAENIKQISNNMMLKNDGTVYSLWDGEWLSGNVEKLTDNGLGLDKNGAIWYTGTNQLHDLKEEIIDLTGIKEITNSYILKMDGTLWLYNIFDKAFSNGEPYPKQLSDFTDVEDIKCAEISTLAEICVVLKKDGTVWWWLRGQHSTDVVPTKAEELEDIVSIATSGDLEISYRASGMEIPGSVKRIIAVKSDGTVWQSKYPKFEQVKGITNAVSAKVGRGHYLILSNKGEVFSFGENTNGKLGNGTSSTVKFPKKIAYVNGAVKIGADVGHTAVLTNNGTIFEWYNTDMSSRNFSFLTQSDMHQISVPNSEKMNSFSVSPYSTTINYSNSFYSLSKNGKISSGEIANQDSLGNEPIDVIETAQNRSERVGALGNSPIIAKLKSDGTVWVKDYYPFEYFLVEGLSNVASIGMSYYDLYALKNDGTVWVGSKNCVQIDGLNDISAISCGHSYSLALKRDGTVYQINGRNVTCIDMLSNIISVAVGGVTYSPKTSDAGKRNNYFVALSSDGSIWAWGNNSNGHLGKKGMTTNVAEKIVQSKVIYSVNDTAMVFEGNECAVDQGRNTVPIIISGRVCIPIRSLIEKLGGTVQWSGDQNKISIIFENKKVEMWIDKNEYIVDGVSNKIDVAPQIVNDRVMVPLRFVTEELGFTVSWDDDYKVVYID